MHEHIDIWLSICDQKDIKVTARSVAENVKAYHASHSELVKHDSEATQ